MFGCKSNLPQQPQTATPISQQQAPQSGFGFGFAQQPTQPGGLLGQYQAAQQPPWQSVPPDMFSQFQNWQNQQMFQQYQDWQAQQAQQAQQALPTQNVPQLQPEPPNWLQASTDTRQASQERHAQEQADKHDMRAARDQFQLDFWQQRYDDRMARRNARDQRRTLRRQDVPMAQNLPVTPVTPASQSVYQPNPNISYSRDVIGVPMASGGLAALRQRMGQ